MVVESTRKQLTGSTLNSPRIRVPHRSWRLEARFPSRSPPTHAMSSRAQSRDLRFHPAFQKPEPRNQSVWWSVHFRAILWPTLATFLAFALVATRQICPIALSLTGRFRFNHLLCAFHLVLSRQICRFTRLSALVKINICPFEPSCDCAQPAANCRARSVARITALISVTRSPPSSSSRMPSMVQPAGVVTASFSSAG